MKLETNSIEDEWDVEYELPKQPERFIPKETQQSAKSPNVPDVAPNRHQESAWDSHQIPHKNKLRAFPAFATRSALFKAANASGNFGQLTQIKAQGASIHADGPKLDMRDKWIWEIAIELAKQRAGNVGDRFEIELREFARRMGNHSPNSRALCSIWESLTKLALVRVVFSLNRGCIQGVGSLVASAVREGDKRFLRLNPDFAVPALLCDLQFEMNSARRANISSALGQWLHDFYSTHSESRQMDLGYLMELSGYEGPPKNFPAKLRVAMNELVKAAPEVASGYSITKPTRSCKSWILDVNLGSEKRAFLPAKTLPSGAKPSGKVAL